MPVSGRKGVREKIVPARQTGQKARRRRKNISHFPKLQIVGGFYYFEGAGGFCNTPPLRGMRQRFFI